MSRFGTQYQVARPTGVCAASGNPLEPGSTCVAALCERSEDAENAENAENEGFERLDYTLEAWEAGARPERLFSFWKTVVAEPGARRRLFVDDEVLVDLFVRLADETQPRRVAFRFVLALILMRKKLLRFAGRKAAAREAAGNDAAGPRAPEQWLMRLRGSAPEDPPIEVANPHLDDDDVRELTAQLGEILQSEF